ncbi:hypothetical protein LINPERPRIM_LOCUS35796 [Linum perenne]
MTSRPSWLPFDWTVESKFVKTGPSRGTIYKCYTEIGTGKKLYSRPKVLEYLKKCGKKTGNRSKSTQEASSGTTVQQALQIPLPAIGADDWNEIAGIYNKAVAEAERIPMAVKYGDKEGTFIFQNSSSIAFENGGQDVEDYAGKLVIYSSSDTDELMDELLTPKEGSPEAMSGAKDVQEAAAVVVGANVQEAAAVVVGANVQEAAVVEVGANVQEAAAVEIGAMANRSSKRPAGDEFELEMLLAEDGLPRKTGPRSARKRVRHFGNMETGTTVVAASSATGIVEPMEGPMENVNGPEIVKPMEGPMENVNGPAIVEPMEGPMDSGMVEREPIVGMETAGNQENVVVNDQEPIVGMETAGNQENVAVNDQVPMEPLMFHRDILSNWYMGFAVAVMGNEYETTNHDAARTLYEEAMADPFFEYACATVPGPSQFYPFHKLMEMFEFEMDVERCKWLPNFGFPHFDGDVTKHFEDPPTEKASGSSEASSSGHGGQGDQLQNGNKSSGTE